MYGATVVIREQTKAQQIRTDLSGAALAQIRNIAEERVTAALGVPAAVVGFGSGLEQTKVGATMRELRRQDGKIASCHKLRTLSPKPVRFCHRNKALTHR